MLRTDFTSIFLRYKGKKNQGDGDQEMRPSPGAFAISSIIMHAAILFYLLPHFLYLVDEGNSYLQSRSKRNLPLMVVSLLRDEPLTPTVIESSAKPEIFKPEPIAKPTSFKPPETTNFPANSTIYHSPSELTVKPELIQTPPNEHPITLENNTTGYVRMLLNIDKFGVVNSVTVLRSTVDRETEGRIALRFYKSTYRPGEINGRPVASQLEILVQTEFL